MNQDLATSSGQFLGCFSWNAFGRFVGVTLAGLFVMSACSLSAQTQAADAQAQDAENTKRPNVVFILADDQG